MNFARGYSLIWPIGDVPMDRVCLFYLPFLNKVYNFVRVCPNHKQDEIFWFSKYTKAMTKPCICSIAIANKWFKNRTACILSFLLNRGIKTEGVVLNRYVFQDFFCPKQGQSFKPSAAY